MKKRIFCLLLSLILLFSAVCASARTTDETETSLSASPTLSPTPTPTLSPSPTPTLTPSPSPTETPLPTPTPTLRPNQAPWFDYSALLGDSISDGLRIYAERKRKTDADFLGNMQFFTKVGYSLSYASAKSPKKLVKYKGKSMRPEDALSAMGAKKVFIMLGINDIFHTETENRPKYSTLIDNIRAKNPGIKIALIAITPIVTDGQHSAFKNSKVNEYNEFVKNVSNEKGCDYIDFNDQLRDKTGGLKPSYSNDQFVHLKGGAFEIYAAALSQNAQYMSR